MDTKLLTGDIVTLHRVFLNLDNPGVDAPKSYTLVKNQGKVCQKTVQFPSPNRINGWRISIRRFYVGQTVFLTEAEAFKDAEKRLQRHIENQKKRLKELHVLQEKRLQRHIENQKKRLKELHVLQEKLQHAASRPPDKQTGNTEPAFIFFLAVLAILVCVAHFPKAPEVKRPTCEQYADRPGLEAIRGTDANGNPYCYVTDGTRLLRVIR